MKKFVFFLFLCVLLSLNGCHDKVNRIVVFYPTLADNAVSGFVDLVRLEQSYRSALEDLRSYYPELTSSGQWSFQFKHVNAETAQLYNLVKNADGQGVAGYAKEQNVHFFITTELFSPADGLPFAHVRSVVFIPDGNFRKTIRIGTRVSVDNLYSAAFWKPFFLQLIPLLQGENK